MIRLVSAELLKVRTTRLWIGLLIGALLLNGAGALLLLALAGTAEGRDAGLTPISTTEDARMVVSAAAQVVQGQRAVANTVLAESVQRAYGGRIHGGRDQPSEARRL